MLSTRNISQGFSKYLSPKLVASSCQKVNVPTAVEAAKDEPYTKSPYRVNASFGPSLNLSVVGPGLRKFDYVLAQVFLICFFISYRTL